MKKINKYGVSRSRDKKGKIVKRELKDYTMCIHASVGGGRETMWVLIAEVYEEEKNQIIQIGNVYQSQFDNPTRGRVYSVNGLAPTINTCGGGGLQPMILECYEYKTCEHIEKQ